MDEFPFSTIYTLYLNRAGTTFGFPRRGWGQVRKCWIIYLQACLCHVIYFHDTVSPEVGFQVSFWSKTEQYDRFCAFKGVDLGYPKIFPSFNFFLSLHHGIVMSKYIICQSFKIFRRAVFSIAHPKYRNCGGILDARW